VQAVDLAQSCDQLALVCQCGTVGNVLIDEIVEARQLPQSDLTAEFVEPRHAAFAVADDIERRHVDLAVDAWPQIDVLQELRMILQRQQAEPLASHRERPVR
jgi:hypothetical protein